MVSKVGSENPGEIVVPASCTSIGANAFKDMALITSVAVGDSVESIGSGAFQGLDSLESISLPFVGSSETPSGSNIEGAFGHVFGYTTASSNAKTSAGKGYTYQGYASGSTYYCYYIPSHLTTVTITRQTAISERAFYNCDLIERIQIPEDATAIGASAFYGCSQLKRLNSASDGVFNLPSAVASIQNETFYGCSSATEFALPTGVASVGEGAFRNCTSVTSFKFPGNVATVGSYAFFGCSSVTEFSLPGMVSIGASAFNGCNAVTKFNSEAPATAVVPDTCTSIGANAFKGMALIESLTVGDSVESIGSGAFRGMDSLKRVSLPFVGASENCESDSEKTLGHAFGYTRTSSSAKTSDGKDYTYQGYGSYYCYYIPSGLTEVTITRQTSIPSRAFYNCDILKTVTLVNSVYSIGDNAFYNCNAEVNKTHVPTRGSTWDGHSVATAFHGGTGTATDPYQIFDPREFVYFANQVNAGNHYENTYFNIVSDLSLGGNKINSIAQDTGHSFKGYFDGKGHTVQNFELTPIESDVFGLFGYLEGTICNVGFENMTCSATMTTNANVYVGMLVGNLTGTMSNCYVAGSLNINANRALYTGGLVGENNGKISDCYSNVKLTAKSTNQKCYVGGLVGFNNGSLVKCFSCGDISSTGYAQSYSLADALIGDEGTSSTFSDCFHSDNQQIVAHGVAVPASESKGTNASIAAIVAFCKANWTYKGWNYSKNLPTF